MSSFLPTGADKAGAGNDAIAGEGGGACGGVGIARRGADNGAGGGPKGTCTGGGGALITVTGCTGLVVCRVAAAPLGPAPKGKTPLERIGCIGGAQSKLTSLTE